MKNFVFISPHFPDSYWKFCLALRNKGFNVLGVGDGPFFEISEECKNTLTEYYCCPFMDHFENEVKAIEYFCNKYGKIDFIESNNEYWLLKDAKLRTIFNLFVVWLLTGVWHGVSYNFILWGLFICFIIS